MRAPLTHTGIQMVKIRQHYTKRGQTYCHITLPTKLMTAYGWKPGEFLMVYPVKDKNGVRAAKLVHQEDAAPADYDRSFKPGPDDLKPPRPGSWAEIEQKSYDKLDQLDRMAQDLRERKIGKRADDDDVSEEAEDETTTATARPTPRRSRTRPRRRSSPRR